MQDMEIYALSLDKVCKSCNTSFRADKPWYFNCKDCSNSKTIVHNKRLRHPQQCVYCKEAFYNNIKVLHLVSGSFSVFSQHAGERKFDTSRRIIPYQLKEEEQRIPAGIRFSNTVCLDHLSSANKQIASLSQMKALKWSRLLLLPPLFRLKCLRISQTPLNDTGKERLLKIMDNCHPAFVVLWNNEIPQELRQIILWMLIKHK